MKKLSFDEKMQSYYCYDFIYLGDIVQIEEGSNKKIVFYDKGRTSCDPGTFFYVAEDRLRLSLLTRMEINNESR